MSNSNSTLQIRVGVAGVAAAIADINKLASGVKGMFAFATAELNPAALLDPIKELVGMGGEFVKLKNQTGATISSLVGIDEAMKRVGGSAADSATLIAKMQRTLSDAVQGNVIAKQGFAAIGLDPQELTKVSADKQLLEIGEAILKLGNDAQAAQVSMQLFGKSGAEMLSVFRNNEAMALLRESGGKFGEVFGRNAEALEQIESSMIRLKEIPRDIAAGFVDMLPVDQISSEIKQIFDSIDFVGFGQKVGAWVALVIDYWKQGRVDEIIDLTIEAGFEQGKRGVSILWDAIKATFSSDTFKLIATQFSISMTDAIADLALDIVVGLGKGFVTVAAEFTKLLDEAVVSVLNFLNSGVNKVRGVLGMKPVAEAKVTPEAELDAQRDAQMADIEAGGQVIKGWVNSFFKRGSDAAKDLWGKAGAEAVTGGASAKLAALISQLQATILGAKKPEAAARPQGSFTSVLPTFSTIEDYVNARLPVVKEKLAEAEADFTKTTVEKWNIRKAGLEEEKQLLQGLVDFYKQKAALPALTEQERNQVKNQQRHAQGELDKTNEGIAKLGPDPDSFSQQFKATFLQLSNQVGTIAQDAARLFADSFNSAVSSISSGIDGLIEGTKTWGEALRDIGTSISRSIIESFVKMATEFVLMHVVMRGAMTVTAAIADALNAKSVAGSIRAFTASAAAGAGKSGEQGGWVGLAIYGVELAAILALITGMAGGFEQGGFTGFGGNKEIAGLVHRNEFVMPAEATSRIGIPRLQAMADGSDSGASFSAPPAQVHVLMVNDMSDVKRYMESKAGERIVVQHVNGRRFDLGMGT